ncbi:MAG: NADH-quinone oxidoreductase subunit N [Saprospirales bacterium]|nr:NADH-quinone oxidoreductase subunit N [Saprospirales bacterium]
MKELLLLSGLGIFALLAEMINARKIIFPAVIAGLCLNIFFCLNDIMAGNNENIFNMLLLDKIPLVFTLLLSVLAIFWFVMAKNYFKDETNLSDHFALVLFSMVGVFLLTSYTHMSMLFLGVEILSIPVYVLAGSDKRNTYSNEAAFKYFLLGAFASGFLLLGITFVYGGTGSFNTLQIASSSVLGAGVSKQLLTIGLLLILFAMAFKVSAVPFHFWTPDVYTGAPTVVTAYMSTIVKLGALAGFYRLFSIVLVFDATTFTTTLIIISVLTIVVGNVIAASQSNTKRLLAFSSIGHAGFVLLANTMLSPSTPYVVWYYLTAYTLSSMAAFWVLIKLDNHDISAFNGLVKRNPLLAGTMTIALLSMAGIPPMAGFFAKYFVLLNTIQNKSVLIAVIAILASLIGVYYYFKIIIAIFSGKEINSAKIELSWLDKIGLVLISILIILLGVLPDACYNLLFR